MSGQGFQVTAFSTLQDLRKRLADDYPISSIVKELLQNAEAACSKTDGAGRLDFAWVAGVAGGRAPVAEGAGDRSTIGRFGRGLKSVFHLGEAFFYASSTADAENPGGHPDNVVSI